MIASAFDEENIILNPPPDMTASECSPLNAFVGATDQERPIIVTCWKPTKTELEEISRTGRLWLVVWGDQMPPVALLGLNPFTTTPDELFKHQE